MKKRNRNFSTEENVTSPKIIETVYMIERDLDTDADALTQRKKKIYVQYQLVGKVIL